MGKKKPQYALSDNAHLVRSQVLFSRTEFLRLVKWQELVGKSKRENRSDFINDVVKKALDKEEKRLNIKFSP